MKKQTGKADNTMRIFTTLIFLCLAISCPGQKIIPAKSQKPIAKQEDKKGVLAHFENKDKLSSSTRLLMAELKSVKGNISDSIIKELKPFFPLKKISGQYYIGAIVKASKDLKASQIKNNGYLIGTKVQGWWTVQIPLSIEKFENLAGVPGIQYIQADEPVKKVLDNARKSVNAGKVHYGNNLPKGYTGKGVVVGIIDKGFDYTHPIWNDTSNSDFRIKKVWNMGGSGSSPSNYSYGTEYAGKTSIQNAQYDINSISHGTHVGGIAGGGYSGSSQKYKGMAPESDLVMVSKVGSQSSFIDGINYIFNYANSANKPSVVNLSWGSNLGPHDGTSSFDQFCENLVGQGNILVGAAGNEGADSIHIEKSFSGNDTVIFSFLTFSNASNTTDGKAIVDIWGKKSSDFKIAVNIYNASNSSYEDWTPYLSTSSNQTKSYTLYDDDFSSDQCEVDITIESSNPNNNKPNARIEIDNTAQDDNYKYVEIQIIGKGTKVESWCTGISGYKPEFTNDKYIYPTINGNRQSTVQEIGGTGDSIISVGAYTSDNIYTDCDGDSYYIPVYEPEGGLASFSGRGPTADSRTKPEITAPGNIVISAVSSFDNSNNYDCSDSRSIDYIQNGGKKWFFATKQGTSMATPMVTGAVALMLEKNPNLNVRQTEKIITNNARQDTFTGSQTNDNWGWGKLDLYQAIKNTPCHTNQQITASNDATICKGDSVSLTAQGGSNYEWKPKRGLSCYNCSNTTASPDSTTLYTVQGITPSGCGSQDTIKISVGAPEADAGKDTAICTGGEVQLNASGGSSFSWSPATGLSCTSCATPKASPNSTTTYTLVVKNSGNCSDTDKIKVTVNSEPTANAGNDVTICEGEETTLSATGGSSYAWTPSNGLSCTNCPTPESSPNTTTTYKVATTNSVGCSDTDQVKVTVNAKPTANAGSDTAICEGERVQLNGAGGSSFSWSPSAGLSCTSCPNPEASPGSDTEYEMITTTSSGCSDTDHIQVTVNSKPKANAGSDVTICKDEQTQLNATGGSSYNWSPAQGLSCVNCQSPTADSSQTTTYHVTVTDNNGCKDSDSVRVNVEDCSSGIENNTDFENLSIYPNPNEGKFSISFYSQIQQSVFVTLQDLSGKIIYKDKLVVDQGKFSKSLHLKDYSSGMYLLKIKTSEGLIGRKIELHK